MFDFVKNYVYWEMNLTDYKNDLEKFEKKLTVGAREQKLGFIILFKKIVQFCQN